MHGPNVTAAVNWVDDLLDGLARYAVEPETTTVACCERAIQTAESILGLRWTAMVGAVADNQPTGNDSGVLLAGGDLAAQELARLNRDFPRVATTENLRLAWLQIANQTPSLQTTPIALAGQTWGWLVAGRSPQDTFSTVDQEILAAIGEIMVEHLLARQTMHGNQRTEFEQRMDLFKLNAHRRLELDPAATLIVNDLRWLCGCERVSLLTNSQPTANPKFNLSAVSSVAKPDLAGDFKRHLCQLASSAVAADLPLASDHLVISQGQSPKGYDKLQQQLDRWQQDSHFEFAFGLPIRRPDGQAIGYLFFEAHDTIDRPAFARALRQIQPHVALALFNAQRFQSIPFRSLAQWLGQRATLSTGAKVLLAGGLVTAIVAAMTVIEMPFRVRTDGVLLPRLEQQVCARIDGNLDSVLVQHGQRVAAGQLLATMENEDLESELDDVLGEYAKTKQLVESKKILLQQIGHSGDQALASRLAAEISDLDFQLQLIVSRRDFLNQKKDKLNIVAPRAGQIITWQTEAKLLGRPVQWGDDLFNIADLSGAWDLVLSVPENRIGYVVDDNQTQHVADGRVQFFLQSAPAIKYSASIIEISSSSQVDPEFGKITQIRCTVPDELKLQARRHGASVVAEIGCGHRPLWFVCCGEFVDRMRRRWVF